MVAIVVVGVTAESLLPFHPEAFVSSAEVVEPAVAEFVVGLKTQPVLQWQLYYSESSSLSPFVPPKSFLVIVAFAVRDSPRNVATDHVM